MNYKLSTPCSECPFLIGSGFEYKQLVAHASGEFGCHKACKLDAKTGVFQPKKNTPHCAGALIFLEKQNAPHQMMRIAERLGKYDRTKLDIHAPVVSSPSDCLLKTKRFRIRVTRGIVREYDARELGRPPFDRIMKAGEYEVTANELRQLIDDSEWHGDVGQCSGIEWPSQTKAMYRRFHAKLIALRGDGRPRTHLVVQSRASITEED